MPTCHFFLFTVLLFSLVQLFNSSSKYDHYYFTEFRNNSSTSLSLVPSTKILNYFVSHNQILRYQLYYTILNFTVLVFGILILHIIYCLITSLYAQLYLVNAFLVLFFCFFLVIINLTLVQSHQIISVFLPLLMCMNLFHLSLLPIYALPL